MAATKFGATAIARATRATSAKPAATGPVPAAVAKAAQYGQVDALLVESNSRRSIVRATGVSCVSIAKRIRKKRRPVAYRILRPRPKKARKQRWEVLELDEMGSFVGA